ncbi:unnamed protein product [Urochloa humidicola]
MAQSMEEMTKKLDGLEALMQKLADKFDENSTRLHRLETAAPPPPPPEIQQVLDKLDATSLRISRLEAAPPPPHPSSAATTIPPPPARWVKQIDLNTASHQEARPSASTWERPSGHRVESGNRDVGGGILGSHPPHPVTGMNQQPPPCLDFPVDPSATIPRSHKPKMDFPKFDGTKI